VGDCRKGKRGRSRHCKCTGVPGQQDLAPGRSPNPLKQPHTARPPSRYLPSSRAHSDTCPITKAKDIRTFEPEPAELQQHTLTLPCVGRNPPSTLRSPDGAGPMATHARGPGFRCAGLRLNAACSVPGGIRGIHPRQRNITLGDIQSAQPLGGAEEKERPTFGSSPRHRFSDGESS